MSKNGSRSIFAPAKINLFLHVTGRQDDGYHLLDSLVAFADVGDKISIEPAADFAFEVTGEFAGRFSQAELDSSPNSGNLVVRAVWKMAEAARKKPDVKITLEKNLPQASGVGGGSADAAAAIWGMLEHWGLSPGAAFLEDVMMSLGSDIKACFACRALRMRGRGELIDDVDDMPEMPVVLVNPGRPCSTGMVFSLFPGPFRTGLDVPATFSSRASLVNFLATCANDLTETAIELTPEIATVMTEIQKCKNVLISRMCGSGPTCYALFESMIHAEECAEKLRAANAGWWVRTGWINRPQRY